MIRSETSHRHLQRISYSSSILLKDLKVTHMAPIHIDETAGSDDTGEGTQEKPYKSLGQALFNHGPTSSYLIRKDQTVQYDEPTQTSLKKAKKTADGIEKKKKKQEELAERNAKEKGEENEKREKLLEESKKIILEEDVSLPKATKVRIYFFFYFHSKIVSFFFFD